MGSSSLRSLALDTLDGRPPLPADLDSVLAAAEFGDSRHGDESVCCAAILGMPQFALGRDVDLAARRACEALLAFDLNAAYVAIGAVRLALALNEKKSRATEAFVRDADEFLLHTRPAQDPLSSMPIYLAVSNLVA